jgi:hypothetical protein
MIMEETKVIIIRPVLQLYNLLFKLHSWYKFFPEGAANWMVVYALNKTVADKKKFFSSPPLVCAYLIDLPNIYLAIELPEREKRLFFSQFSRNLYLQIRQHMVRRINKNQVWLQLWLYFKNEKWRLYEPHPFDEPVLFQLLTGAQPVYGVDDDRLIYWQQIIRGCPFSSVSGCWDTDGPVIMKKNSL